MNVSFAGICLQPPSATGNGSVRIMARLKSSAAGWTVDTAFNVAQLGANAQVAVPTGAEVMLTSGLIVRVETVSDKASGPLEIARNGSGRPVVEPIGGYVVDEKEVNLRSDRQLKVALPASARAYVKTADEGLNGPWRVAPGSAGESSKLISVVGATASNFPKESAAQESFYRISFRKCDLQALLVDPRPASAKPISKPAAAASPPKPASEPVPKSSNPKSAVAAAAKNPAAKVPPDEVKNEEVQQLRDKLAQSEARQKELEQSLKNVITAEQHQALKDHLAATQAKLEQLTPERLRLFERNEDLEATVQSLQERIESLRVRMETRHGDLAKVEQTLQTRSQELQQADERHRRLIEDHTRLVERREQLQSTIRALTTTIESMVQWAVSNEQMLVRRQKELLGLTEVLFGKGAVPQVAMPTMHSSPMQQPYPSPQPAPPMHMHPSPGMTSPIQVSPPTAPIPAPSMASSPGFFHHTVSIDAAAAHGSPTSAPLANRDAADLSKERFNSLLDNSAYPAAVELAQKAVQQAERTLPANHPEIADWLQRLGQALELNGQFEEARPILRRALKLRISPMVQEII